MKKVAVIMAGGKGERFWPKSRKNMPKQFLSLTSEGKTMLQHTVERIQPLIDLEDIFIVTNKEYEAIVLEQLPYIKKENIIGEPIAKNTAPCIGLAAIHVRKKYKDAVMIVLPSDHLVKNSEIFLETIEDGIKVADEKESIVTIGIIPSYPETGYGYIHFEGSIDFPTRNKVYQVEGFREKPDLQKAKDYLGSGEYLWNSGMFIWKSSILLNYFEELLPEIYKGLKKIEEAFGTEQEKYMLEKEFRAFKAESVDYGILEKVKHIYTLTGHFGWDDVGSWLALERINKTNEEGNIIKGNVMTIEVKDCIIEAQEKLIAIIGIENVVVVDSEDALLICNKSKVQEVKMVIENLKLCNKQYYL